MADDNMNINENNSKVVQVDDVDFGSQVLQSKQPVLVAFLTSWSQPCTILAPVLDEIACECSGKLKVVSVNADGNLDLSLAYAVQSVPTLLYFVSGNVHAKIVGTATKEALLSKCGVNGETKQQCALDQRSGTHQQEGEQSWTAR